MNFGYPNTPYAANMGEQYMGNVGTNPAMGMSMEYMQPTGGCGCGGQMPFMGGYNQQSFGQVVQQTCAVDMPYYVNYNTHAVSNLCYIKRLKKAKKVPKSVQNGVFLDEN